jgi:hypothetical protein
MIYSSTTNIIKQPACTEESAQTEEKLIDLDKKPTGEKNIRTIFRAGITLLSFLFSGSFFFSQLSASVVDCATPKK